MVGLFTFLTLVFIIVCLFLLFSGQTQLLKGMFKAIGDLIYMIIDLIKMVLKRT